MAVSRKNLNQSMQETQRFLTEGKTLQEIAEQRKIKLSTIHDHLLELAIQGQLQASVYLEKEAMLQNLAQTEQDLRLWVYRLASARSDAFLFRFSVISNPTNLARKGVSVVDIRTRIIHSIWLRSV